MCIIINIAIIIITITIIIIIIIIIIITPHSGELRHFRDDPVFPDPVWKL